MDDQLDRITLRVRFEPLPFCIGDRYVIRDILGDIP
jgi:hypothetical protein